MDRSEIMSLIEQVKNGNEAAMGELGILYKDLVQNTALSFTTPTKNTQELADALLAVMYAFETLVINFQGDDIKGFNACLEKDLKDSTDEVLTKIREYKTNYTLAELTTLAETDKLAHLMLTTRQVDEVNSYYHHHQTKLGLAAGFFSKLKTVIGGPLLSNGKIMPADLRGDTAAQGAMVVHLRPVFNTNGPKSTL